MSGVYYSENKILDQLFGATSIAASIPSTWYVGLSTTAPNEAGTGVTEPAAGAYARVAYSNTKTGPVNWTTAANGALTNAAAITFIESTLSWGTISHVVFYDLATGGNLWFWEALPSPRAVAANTTVYFAIGSLTVSNLNAG